jgi:hypothetical protein
MSSLINLKTQKPSQIKQALEKKKKKGVFNTNRLSKLDPKWVSREWEALKRLNRSERILIVIKINKCVASSRLKR